MRQQIDNGLHAKFWTDHWLPDGPLRDKIEGPLPQGEEDRSIDSIFSSGRWNFQTIPVHLPLDLQEHTLGHPIPFFPINPDKLLWPGPTGHCTVKQATKFLFICEGVESNAAYWNWI